MQASSPNTFLSNVSSLHYELSDSDDRSNINFIGQPITLVLYPFNIQLKIPVCKLTVKMDCPSFKDTQVVLGVPIEESSINTKPSSQATSSTAVGVSLSGEWI